MRVYLYLLLCVLTRITLHCYNLCTDLYFSPYLGPWETLQLIVVLDKCKACFLSETRQTYWSMKKAFSLIACSPDNSFTGQNHFPSKENAHALLESLHQG